MPTNDQSDGTYVLTMIVELVSLFWIAIGLLGIIAFVVIDVFRTDPLLGISLVILATGHAGLYAARYVGDIVRQVRERYERRSSGGRR